MSNHVGNFLPDRLRSLRIGARLTWDELGKRAGLPAADIAGAEAGLHVFGEVSMEKLADVFGVEADYFFGGEEKHGMWKPYLITHMAVVTHEPAFILAGEVDLGCGTFIHPTRGLCSTRGLCFRKGERLYGVTADNAIVFLTIRHDEAEEVFGAIVRCLTNGEHDARTYILDALESM